MAIKKSDLYSTLWKSCDELRGGMDASQYKDYVLVLLFVKYVSDKYAGQPGALIEVPEGGGFADMVALKGDKEIGDKFNKIIARLAEANDLRGDIDVADFNDPGKLGSGIEMVDRLSNLVAIFENPGLDFSRNRAEGDDLLGDAYEYLMRHFATESGKSKGQFYTPAEVSRIMAKVIGIDAAESQDWTIYDPTCGSGSLLLKAADETPRGVTIYGQEMDVATKALAKMNMILHDNPTAEIWRGNTLANPYFKNPDGSLKSFDFVVANPPFSNKAWSTGLDPANDVYGRFELGIPPRKNGDYAFLLHLLRSMKSSGKGAIVMPHGVLFRGNVEADIRRNIVRRGYIKGIIGLPPNLFYGTGIPACIVVLDKENAPGRNAIFMIDASKAFVKDGNKNRLRHQDIHKIVDVFNNQIELPKYSHLVSHAEIQANDYNLNIPRYIDSSEHEDLQDIEAHLLGGIPDRDIDDLERYWDVFPTLRDSLFASISRPGYSEIRIPATEIKSVILTRPEFEVYAEIVREMFVQWRENNIRHLKCIDIGTNAKQLITHLSESLLETFSPVWLIDNYDVYQHLMSYWSETMQDDVYMIADEGWLGANKLRLLDGNNNQTKEKSDLVVNRLKYKADLIPPLLIINRYFKVEQEAIAKLESEKDVISGQVAELAEEHSGDEGLLEEVRNDKGNITKTAVKARMKETKDDADFADEYEVLKTYIELIDHESELKKQFKERQAVLDKQVLARYETLSEQEIKTLVIDDKWTTSWAADVQSEIDRVSHALTGRVGELAERYAFPLPQMTEDVDCLNAKVNEHLHKMGFEWNWRRVTGRAKPA